MRLARPGECTIVSGSKPKVLTRRDAAELTTERYHRLRGVTLGPVKPVSAVLVGAGQRGRYVYGAHAVTHPEELVIAAVVDTDAARRDVVGELHGLPANRRFADYREALEVDAEAWIVATSDRAHHAPARAALDSGIPVLLEKPMAASIAETVDLVGLARRRGTILTIGHVLRYTPFFTTLHETIASGRLGDIVTVEHRENVVAWHMAHSFVRGNWGRSSAATPMIVAKCCHDFDVLAWNLDSPVRSLTSVGSLFHFRPEEAPQGATARCVDDCPVEACPYDARRIYLDPSRQAWPVHVITDDLSREGRMAALREGPYGRCAFLAGSDVVDHQVVTMELDSGASVVLVMHGHSHEEARTMRYDGTRATLRATFGARQEIEVTDHATGRTESVPIGRAAGGHGGGDAGIVSAFVRSARSGEPPLTAAIDSLESHYLAFAAEEARLSGARVDMAEYRARYPV